MLSAWKALRSVATITGDEVLGRSRCNSSTWKAVRLWKCLFFLFYGVVPSRHVVLAPPIRGLRPRLSSLRSVLPSRQLHYISARLVNLLINAHAPTSLPHNNSCRHAYIQRMLRAVLRNFYHAIASIYYVLPHSFHFVAEHKGVFFFFFKNKLSEFMAGLGLLHRQRFITRFLKSEDCVQRVADVFPCHGIFSTQSRLMYLG